jgi:hypothetical protein
MQRAKTEFPDIKSRTFIVQDVKYCLALVNNETTPELTSIFKLSNINVFDIITKEFISTIIQKEPFDCITLTPNMYHAFTLQPSSPDDFYMNKYVRVIVRNLLRLDPLEDKEPDFESLVVLTYGNFDEVKAIYVDEYLEEKKITILLDIKEYDDNLIESLIEKELEIFNIYPDIIATFNYIPVLIDTDHTHIVGKNSRLIYEK